MGYRNYIATIPKREYNKIKSMTCEQLIEHYNIEVDKDGYWYKGVYDYGTELYEFGKYVDFDPPKSSMKPFFKKKETQLRYVDDYEFFVVTPEFLEYIINHYTEKINKYYSEMVTPFYNDDHNFGWSEFLKSAKRGYNMSKNKDTYEFDFSKITKEEQTALYEIINHVRSNSFEWDRTKPFNLKEGTHVSTSWKYEYSIFELVRIYKTFDWKRNVMFYYGY